jgi:VanZ family protein
LPRALGLWGPVAAWAGAIFLASSLSDPPGAGLAPDWLSHAVEYLVLALLGCRAVAGGLRRPLAPRAAALVVVLCVAYGAADELHQSFVPGRDASAGDVAKDAAGAVLGAIVQRRLAAASAARRRAW